LRSRILGSYGSRAWQVFGSAVGATTHLIAGASVFVVVAYARLAHDRELRDWSEHHTPIDARHLMRIWSAFSETGRGLFIGFGGAGLAQSTIATVTYAVLGVPHAFVLGVLTLLASVIPGIGTGLVWMPVAIGLALTGRTTAAAIVVIVGLALVGTIDNVLKPLLARYGRLELPASLVFVSMLGGLIVVGPTGLLLGPVVVRLAKELIVIAREERTTCVEANAPDVQT
jgi:predicted PurR-regulated permease PerM